MFNKKRNNKQSKEKKKRKKKESKRRIANKTYDLEPIVKKSYDDQVDLLDKDSHKKFAVGVAKIIWGSDYLKEQ